MIYPEFINNKPIGVVAPSCGITDELDKVRFENAAKKLKEKGVETIFGPNVFKSDIKGASASASERAREFNDMVSDPVIGAIVSAIGGDYMCEMLDYVDFDAVKNNPKWFMGYSDNTSLTFSITTLTDVASIYFDNYGSFGMEPWHKAVDSTFNFLYGNYGKTLTLDSYKKHESNFKKYVTGLETYLTDTDVKYKAYENGKITDELSFSGRVIGGCVDLISFLAGTKYEDFLGFVQRYKQDKVILYLESFVGNSEETVRILWRLKNLGWFEDLSGVIIGRPTFVSSDYEVEYEEAVLRGLDGRVKNVVFGADIGHRLPQFSMINGSYATIDVKDFSARLTQELI